MVTTPYLCSCTLRAVCPRKRKGHIEALWWLSLTRFFRYHVRFIKFNHFGNELEKRLAGKNNIQQSEKGPTMSTPLHINL